MYQGRLVSLGYIYVLSNPSISNGLKIGFTKRPVEERVKELSSSTGVPTPFVIEYWKLTNDVEGVERLVHKELGQFRLNSNREFFNVALEVAVDAIKDNCIPVITEFERDTSLSELLTCRRCGDQWERKDSRFCPSCWD